MNFNPSWISLDNSISLLLNFNIIMKYKILIIKILRRSFFIYSILQLIHFSIFSSSQCYLIRYILNYYYSRFFVSFYHPRNFIYYICYSVFVVKHPIFLIDLHSLFLSVGFIILSNSTHFFVEFHHDPFFSFILSRFLYSLTHTIIHVSFTSSLIKVKLINAHSCPFHIFSNHLYYTLNYYYSYIYFYLISSSFFLDISLIFLYSFS